MLYCVECGCSSDALGRGWVALRCDVPDRNEPDDLEPAVAIYCPTCAAREFGHRPETAARRPRGMEPPGTFSVTMVRPGVVPSFEVGVYEYFGRGLPLVGETILMRRTDGSQTEEGLRGYVTRVNPSSNSPIAVMEVPHPTS